MRSGSDGVGGRVCKASGTISVPLEMSCFCSVEIVYIYFMVIIVACTILLFEGLAYSALSKIP